MNAHTNDDIPPSHFTFAVRDVEGWKFPLKNYATVADAKKHARQHLGAIILRVDHVKV
jgi:hypothetical protein